MTIYRKKGYSALDKINLYEKNLKKNFQTLTNLLFRKSSGFQYISGLLTNLLGYETYFVVGYLLKVRRV